MTIPLPYAIDLAGRDPLVAMQETPQQVRALAATWSSAQFEYRYAPGKWSARQILVHLAQTELALGYRARMAVSTPFYTAQPFDQDRWIDKETALSGHEALDAFVAIAAMNLRFFSSLSSADREVTLTHPEYDGAMSVGWIFQHLAGHEIHHLAQLERIAQQPTPTG
jgi:uncharacterized damage-inducible protein DinB